MNACTPEAFNPLFPLWGESLSQGKLSNLAFALS